MKTIGTIMIVLLLVSCGYHLRNANNLALKYPEIKLSITAQSELRRPLIKALIASGVKLHETATPETAELVIHKDRLQKIIQSVGVNNQIQEFRLEYDVQYSIKDEEKKSITIERDYSFDIQQIGGGQSEEMTLRKQLAQDMAQALIRQLNVINSTQL